MENITHGVQNRKKEKVYKRGSLKKLTERIRMPFITIINGLNIALEEKASE